MFTKPILNNKYNRVLAMKQALVLVLIGLLSMLSLSASAQTMMGSDTKSLRLAPGDQRILNYPNRITRVATSDPEAVAVTVSESTQIMLTAKNEGTSVLTVWMSGMAEPMLSTVAVAATAGHHLPFGTQVQTDIRVLEVSRSKLNAFGFDYESLGGKAAVGIGTGAGAGEGFNFFRRSTNASTMINALERGGFAYTLAEPSLTALSGQTATFLSGGEFPVPVRGGGSGITDNTQVEYKSFGIGLALTPTVIDEDQIILKVAPEVSELDTSSGVQSGGVAVPGLRVRRTETTVSLAPGETFIISGLVSRNTVNSSDRIPGLGNIPVLGAFFRSTRIEREDKELIMVVTPHLVSPKSSTMPPGTLPGAGYHDASTGWLDMMTETRSGAEPIRHGLSW